MRAAIIGLPQSGKSTIYAAATGQAIDPGEAPQERLGTVTVPEPRVEVLAEIYKPKKKTYTTLEFLDVPGFSLADSRGVDEFKKHLPAIRLADVLVSVIRDFDNPAVPLYRERRNPQADLREVWEELIFADLEAVSNRMERLEKSLKKPTKTHDAEKREMQVMERCREALENERPLAEVLTAAEDQRIVASFAFLTQKPWVVVYNVDEDRAAAEQPKVPEHARAAVSLCAETEAEIAQMDEADRPVFLADLGVTEPARDRLLQACREAAGLITFLTAGETEVRAWTIKRNATAVEAAGSIHTDMARGFIRAETVSYDDLCAAGDMRSAKADGKVRQEGKTYVVQDGDVILMKFNV